ncbi:MAG: amidohydrolase [Anaerovoracaceae bacterium]
MEQRDMDRIQTLVKELTPELKKLALDIHENPEMGNQEFKACRWQIDLLNKYGFETCTGFCGIDTAYKASYAGNRPGPKIAMLAEYDALPELGHACGHNLIAMMSVGSGIVIKEFVDKYGGEIHVIGTPAEETQGAKVEMSARGAFKGYDVVMMAHPFETNGSSRNTIAMIARQFEFFGKSAHAASEPYEGINALDAVINFFNMINALRQQTKPDARIHGIIEKGGDAPNIIPEYTRARFYIRANKMAYVEELLEKVTACARGAAAGAGAEMKCTKVEADFKDTDSNMYLSELACRQYEKLGHEIKRYGKEILSGSSDLGDVSYDCPSIQLMAGMGAMADGSHYGPHTVEFARKTCSEEAIENCLEFVKAFAMTAVELMTDPSHLEAIRKEFSEK